MAKTTTRVRLTRGQKQQLRAHHQGHSKKSLRVLCKQAVTAFQLQLPPAHSTLVALFKGSDGDDARSTEMTNHRVICPRLERELIRDDITKDASATTGSALLTLPFSNGWLQKSLICHGLKSGRLHGEAASASAEAVDRGRLALQSVTAGYEKKDTFNMDEIAFFYCVVPTISATKNSISRRKNTKKRLTVAVASNANGSFKLSLLFVGAVRQPRCFKGKTGEELGVDYVNASKGRMNTQLFRAWLTKLNETMRRDDRHMLLLLDDASYHQSGEQLSNFQALMLLPDTTVHLQPKMQVSGAAHVLDEATTNVDQELDRLIQVAVKENFQDKTAMTIAHRLETIADSDRILVLDHGEVQEFDSPANLLAKSDGMFASLINSTKE